MIGGSIKELEVVMGKIFFEGVESPSGLKEDGDEIDVFGIPYPFYGDEFPHHQEAYRNQFKKNA